MQNSTEKIWENFSERLRAFISYRVLDHFVIDDILQDVFIKIHIHSDTLMDEAKIQSWIYQITRNTIIDYYRKQKNRLDDIDTIPIEEKDTLITVDEIEEENPEKEITSGLKEMVEALPEKYKEALLLVEFQGLSQVELAKRLGISISGAKSRVQRARLMIKDSLMRCCHFEFDHYGTIISMSPACCCCCPCE